MRNENLLSDLGDKWPSKWVCRRSIGNFSGGILNPRTMANFDTRGIGPKGRVRIGKKVAYPIQEVIQWLEKRAKPLD